LRRAAIEPMAHWPALAQRESRKSAIRKSRRRVSRRANCALLTCGHAQRRGTKVLLPNCHNGLCPFVVIILAYYILPSPSSKMESLIPIVNQLQDICSTVRIPLLLDLPQIVVVGGQSSGKSSIIESIVKRGFLPRGQGMVTRRPLVIRLFKKGLNSNDEFNSIPNDWVKFGHSDRIFTDFDEVRQEIERETDRVCSVNNGISAEPITLNVYSENVVNLTLVDLPGLVGIPVGSQPEDIATQIRELAYEYIKNPNSIILAVTPANQDFATSEALKLAREVDPDRKRTLAVLTKLDLVKPGTDAIDALTGKLLKFRLGIIGVVNRSQEDIEANKSLEQAIADEAEFLQRRFPSIADKNGQTYLSKRLSQLLIRHIHDSFPDLRIRVRDLISKHQELLDSYGEPVTDKAQAIIDILTKFSQWYRDMIKGGESQVKATELVGGARIKYIFHKSFGQALSAIDPLDTLDSKAILTTALNKTGVSTAIHVPAVFELLMTSQIKRLKDPSLRCVELVHEELGRFIDNCNDEVNTQLMRFPRLREKIKEVLTKLLNERLPVTREAVTNLVSYKSAYIDTEHPRLRDSYKFNYADSLESGVTTTNSSSAGGKINSAGGDEFSMRHEQELRDCEIIAQKISAYFNIVRDEIKVSVPEAIMHCMVNHIKSNLHSALIKEVYDSDLFDSLLSESDDIARKRKETADMLNALKRASEVINAIHYQKQQ
jgi:dynamin 1-like protein